jgi:excisionase family DNA binding protein
MFGSCLESSPESGLSGQYSEGAQLMTTAIPDGFAGPKPVLCAEEAAALLGVSRWLLLQEIKRGYIPHKRIGRRLVFSRQKLLDWMQAEE